jgi:hypothetical protein
VEVLNDFFKNDLIFSGESPAEGDCPRLVHLLKIGQYLLGKGGIYEFLHIFKSLQPLVEAEFVGLFVGGIFKLDAEAIVHFERRDFQVRMFDVADDAHELNIGYWLLFLRQK